ncbi:hypothetical protein [Oleiagrimonas sp. C23AA]|uniref:hypothetical protein n=1 Tax=Oleiagrimonas sp. C23AA TaxID=2719047 RepID=UPI001423F52D|nr:hypothetical protein [Oleiagrimonas sp. C23AA]NII09400.1 hypothetical protein [Oleiagrimonas sp. C23AA]
MSKFVLALPLAIMAALIALPATAHADDLLMRRVQQESHMPMPTRGMSMAQVEKHFGHPLRKLSPRGGDARLHPVIHRWEYKHYIVYFERNHVIHSVLNTPAGNNRHPQSAR